MKRCFHHCHAVIHKKPYLFTTNQQHKTHCHYHYCYCYQSFAHLSHYSMIMASCLANNASPFLVMLSMCLLICFSEAKQYVVGGSANSWKTPLSSPDSLNHWANSHHFKIGDTLGIYIFLYFLICMYVSR